MSEPRQNAAPLDGVAAGEASATGRVRAIAVVLTLMAAAAALAIFTPRLITNVKSGEAWYRAPDFIPLAMLGLVVLFGALHLAAMLRGAKVLVDDEGGDVEPRGIFVIAGVAAFGAYALLCNWIGYPAATVAVSAGLSLFVGIRLRTVLIFAAAMALVLTVVFQVIFRIAFAPPRLLTLLGLG
jgi:hypothetical protein